MAAPTEKIVKVRKSKKAKTESIVIEKKAKARSVNPYIFFSQSKRAEIKHENISFTETSKKLGQMWKQLSDSEKDVSV